MRELRCKGLIEAPAGVAPWGTVGAVQQDGPDHAAPFSSVVRRGGNQRNTESCVAWAYIGAIFALLGYLKLPQVWFSVLDLYFRTRIISARGDRSQIWDGGSRPDDAAQAARFGVCPDHLHPFDPRLKDKEPPWGVLVEASKHSWLRPRRIVAWGAERAKIIRATLSAPWPNARPVLRGQWVDQAYLDWTPADAPWRLTGKPLGRHMEASLSFAPDGLRHLSSWGDMFDRVIDWDQVENEETMSDWILDVDIDELRELIGKVMSCGLRFC